MQESAMYAAYAYQKQQNLISDAKRHLECFAFGSVAEALEEDVIESEKMEFYGMYGVNYDRIAENLGIIVRQYESAYTESETPASLWEQAIQKTIDVILTQQNEIASYSQLADACRYCNPGVVTLALGVLFQLGTNHISKMTSTDCIQGNLFSVEAKQEALNLARMMAKASLDVLLAVIQREVAQYEDVQGIRIPHLHPNGDKELLCPVCGGNDLPIMAICVLPRTAALSDGSAAAAERTASQTTNMCSIITRAWRTATVAGLEEAKMLGNSN